MLGPLLSGVHIIPRTGTVYNMKQAGDSVETLCMYTVRPETRVCPAGDLRFGFGKPSISAYIHMYVQLKGSYRHPPAREVPYYYGGP